MIFVAALVALHVAVFAWGAVDDVASAAALPFVESGLALAGLAIPSVRQAMIDGLTKYWPAAIAFIVVVALTAQQVGLFAHDAGDGRLARTEAWRWIGFAMGGLAALGGALSARRRQLQAGLLIGAIVCGALAVIQQLQAGRTLIAESEAAAALFALLGVLSVYGGIDALTNRATRAPMERRTTRAERLFLPTAAFFAALIGLVLSGTVSGFAGMGLGLAAMACALIARERRRGAGLILLGALAVASLLLGGVFFLRRAAMTVAFTPAVIAALVAWGALFTLMALSPDRRRRPSRGLALALAGAVVLAVTGTHAPAPVAMLALLLGLAGAHADALTRASSPRSFDRP